MDPRAGFDRLVASITFSGSLLSFIATSLVLIAYVYYRDQQRSFRHALVFNLAFAEFINTLNNTISGAIYLRDHALYPSTACTINGFVGQLSVQAADFSILVIALVTLLTITRTTYMPAASTVRKTLICLSVWIAPLITACIAASLNAIGPVSGNWCWIMKSRTDLRYALTHGWRIAIIFVTTGIYLFVWWYMNRHFRSVVRSMTTTSSFSSQRSDWSGRWRRRGFRQMKDGGGKKGGGGKMEDEGEDEEPDTELSTMSKSRISRIGDDWELSAPEAAYAGEAGRDDHDADVEAGARTAGRKEDKSRRRQRRDSICSVSDDDDDDDDDDLDLDDKRSDKNRSKVRVAPGPEGGITTTVGANPAGHKSNKHLHVPRSAKPDLWSADTMASEFPTRKRTRDMEREIKRMLLLNAYPVMYVLLWIPGLVNRFLEASGNRPSSRALAALQASSQFVGLANALTYGFNKGLRTRVKQLWKKRGT